MIIYQLPNGRIVYISIEEYLNISDNDLNNITGGEYPKSVWEGSVLDCKSSKKRTTVNNELDYIPDSEEIESVYTQVSINSLTMDEIESMEDQDDISEEEES